MVATLTLGNLFETSFWPAVLTFFVRLVQMVYNVVYPMAPDQRRHVSINSARWLPEPGMGLAYGTSKGDLVICRPV